MADARATFHTPVQRELILNGQTIHCIFDYRPGPPTMIGFVPSQELGTLTLTGFRLGQFREIRIDEHSTVILKYGKDTKCLSVFGVMSQSESEVILSVGDVT
jgi:hypothetical protein